ncbi:hypothetical protein SBRCBS47491_006172 [Sporothrix bragantina]|uniref:Rhodopsin domain-containing protein n=1 Tax=Sporothrix bragantina TaxID=671064 RepID=A0ABP0C349_9PEZI
MSLTATSASIVALTVATLTALTTDLATTGTPSSAFASTESASATATATPGRASHGGHSDTGHHRPTDSRRGVIIGVISFILPFTTAVVLLRFYTRHYLSGRAVGADDWMMLVSLVLALVDGSTMLLMTTQGLGHHMWTLTAEQITTYNMYFYLSIVFYYACLGTVKTAILLQYLRVFAVKMRKITLVALVLIGLWSMALVLVSVLACRPIRGFWDKTVAAHCVPDLPQWYVNAAGNIATDVIIFTLPIPVLWRLNLPRSQRLSLIGIFCLGFFTCTISVIRITFLNLNGDDTYANVAAACWSIGELCCAIVCSSLPTLRPIFFRLLPGPLRHNHRHHYHGNSNTMNTGTHGDGIHGSPYLHSSSNNRQSAYLNAYANSLGGFTGFGRDLDHAFANEGFRLKSVRSNDKVTTNTDDSNDAETMGRRSSRTMIIPPRYDQTGKGDGVGVGVGGGTSYYNRFYHQFHPTEEEQQQPRAIPTNDKIGLSFMTTSHLRSSTSLSNGNSDLGLGDRVRGRSLNRKRNRALGRESNRHGRYLDSDSDSDLDRYMQWAGRDYYKSQHYYTPKRTDPEKRDVTDATATAVSAVSPAPATAATTISQEQKPLSTTSSHRSLRELVAELASPRGISNLRDSSSSSNSSRRERSSSSSSNMETLGRAAQAVQAARTGGPDLALGNKRAVRSRRDINATFFLSDDEDNGEKDKDSSKDSSRTGSISPSANKKRAVGSGQSAPSSVAPTRAHSPSPSLPSTPPRSQSYSHLRRMAAAVGAGVSTAVNAGIGVAGSSGSIGAGANEKREAGSSGSGSNSNSKPSTALAAPAISPPMPSLHPTDPLALDRDEYLGLRQGTVTSIEANRPSTAEAEALGTGSGIQIKREVAQNIGPA